MKRHVKKFFSLLLVCAMAVQFLPAAAATVTGWGLINNNGFGAEVELDTTERNSGNASIRISSTSTAEANKYFMLQQLIGVKPGHSYHYSFWAKGDKVQAASVCISWGAKTSVASFGNTWDWRYYEFQWNSGTLGVAEFQVLVEGLVGNLWLDDFEFYELDAFGGKVGGNLLANPGFELDVSAPVNTNTEASVQGGTEAEKLLEDFKQGKETSADEFRKTLGLNGAIPAVYKDSLSVDADFNDWSDGISFSLPAKADQIVVIAPQGGTIDSKVDYAFGYNEEYFYMMAQVEDDIHVGIDGDMYWSGDSIQLCISKTSETFGLEIGIEHSDTTGARVYCSSKTVEELKAIQVATKRVDTTTSYEIAVPWSLTTLDGSSDDALINSIVNENDNDERGRAGCIEITPGIFFVKNNQDYASLNFLPEGEKSYGLVNGAKSLETGVETQYDFYYVNNGGDRDISYTLPGSQEKVTVPMKANSVLYVPFKHTFEESGQTKLSVTVSDGAKDTVISTEIDVILSLEYFEREIKKLEEETVPAIKALIDECESKGMSVEYEVLKYELAVRFIPYIKECLELQKYIHADYELKEIQQLCEEAIASLTSYVNGEAEPLTAYKYVTSELSADGQTIWADMQNTKTGVIERRPMLGVGFGHFLQAQKDIPKFQEYGNNVLQAEIGITGIFKSMSDINYWGEIVNNGTFTEPMDYTWSFDTEEKNSGNASLKFTRTTPAGPNRYTYKYQTYPVKGNTTYNIKLSAKAVNADAWYTPAGWISAPISLSGTYDWTDFTTQYTTTPEQRTLDLFLFGNGTTESLNIDDVVITEAGSTKNIITNGDFEIGYDLPIVDGLRVDVSSIYDTIEMLQRAEDNNVSVNILTSFHYFPDFIRLENLDEINWGYGIGHWYSGFASVNLNSPRVREVIEHYLRLLIPRIKDYKSLNSICVANEPAFCTALGDYYLDDYHEYLKELYSGNIDQLNTNYKTTYLTFDEIPFPEVTALEKGKSAHFYDWFIFNNKVFTEFYEFYTGIIRELAPELPLHMKLMAHMFGSDQDYFRQWLVAGTDAEMLADLFDYNGCDSHSYRNAPDQSILTKVRWYDFMTSVSNKPVCDTESHIIEDAKLNIAPEQAKWWGAEVWEGAIHGRGMSMAWSWEYSHDPVSSFYGGPLMMPDLLAANGKASLDLNRLSYEVKAIQDRKPDVAVLYSQPSWVYSESYHNATYTAWEASLFAGQKTGFVTEKQVAEGRLDQFKLLIVPQCNQVKKETVQQISRYMENGGRVLIVGEDSLKHNEYDLPFDEGLYKSIYEKATVVAATNLDRRVISPSGAEYTKLIAAEMDALGLNNIQLVDAVTGEPAHQVEFLSAPYNGGYVISMNNFTWDGTKSVQLIVNGKKVEQSKELRNNQQLGETFELAPYEPIMVFVEQ